MEQIKGHTQLFSIDRDQEGERRGNWSAEVVLSPSACRAEVVLFPSACRAEVRACVCVCDRGQFRQGVVSCLVLFEESGNARGELTDGSPLLSHHVVQIQSHLTHCISDCCWTLFPLWAQRALRKRVQLAGLL